MSKVETTTASWDCPHCGRIWLTGGSKMGFVSAGVNRHIAGCRDRTPAQRRQRNQKDEAKWKLSATASTIRNEPGHPGLQDLNTLPLNPPTP